VQSGTLLDALQVPQQPPLSLEPLLLLQVQVSGLRLLPQLLLLMLQGQQRWRQLCLELHLPV
jgi:hypothetical protein